MTPTKCRSRRLKEATAFLRTDPARRSLRLVIELGEKPEGWSSIKLSKQQCAVQSIRYLRFSGVCYLISLNNADFFYSRKVKRHNHMWSILPRVFPDEVRLDLAGADKSEKLAFMARTGVDFIDVVESISVREGTAINFSDSFLENNQPRFRNVGAELERIAPLAVCFSRKTTGNIPWIAGEIRSIEEYCKRRSIPFKRLPSPSPRRRLEGKIKEWSDFLLSSNARVGSQLL